MNIKKGFTLIELMVTVSIFVIMTGLLLAKYKTFDNGVVLKNLAYDIALSIRNAQSYGLNVKSTSESSFTGTGEYSVEFKLTDSRAFVLKSGSTEISRILIKRGSYISALCLSDSTDSFCSGASDMTIVFARPDPSALISGKWFSSGGRVSGIQYAEITISAVDGSTKKIVIRENGQIYVSN